MFGKPVYFPGEAVNGLLRRFFLPLRAQGLQDLFHGVKKHRLLYRFHHIVRCAQGKRPFGVIKFAVGGVDDDLHVRIAASDHVQSVKAV